MSNSKVIQVNGLTKRYPEVVAVDGIDFEVSQGEVVGFLGPNGAGKTTTLKMLTCFMPPTAGKARINGFDIYTQSLKVRRAIGYLPENNALYEEMSVREYLRFRAALKRVRWSQRSRNVDEAIDLCGLGPMVRRTIGQLSKGYRQRVGLADTLVAKPPVLILDEPTVGLDPRQIVDVRRLIQRLAGENTILLSTHYLPEVEQICDRALIIHKGRIVLDQRLDELQTNRDGESRSLEEVFLEVTGEDPRSVGAELKPTSDAKKKAAPSMAKPKDGDGDDAKSEDDDGGDAKSEEDDGGGAKSEEDDGGGDGDDAKSEEEEKEEDDDANSKSPSKSAR